MKIEISLYRHFSFDLWLTLIRSNPQFKQKRAELLMEFFMVKLKPEKVREIIHYYDVLSNRISEITGKHMDMEKIYLLVLRKAGVNIGQLDNSLLLNFYKETETLFMKYKPVLMYPDIDRLFKKMVEHGKTINILSNTAFIQGSVLRRVLEYYELSDYVSFQLYSDETGYSKPNKEVFDMVFHKANNANDVSRAEIVHIGDNEIADFEGARKAGLQSILIKNQ
jgi:putative hydrolase of the HAD superfamily